MTESVFCVHVRRVDRDTLVLDGLGLAEAFFCNDLSSQPGGYDSLAGSEILTGLSTRT